MDSIKSSDNDIEVIKILENNKIYTQVISCSGYIHYNTLLFLFI
jgi:hypothetical protein